MNMIIAVSDAFEEFSKKLGLIRYSDLIEKLSSNETGHLVCRDVIEGLSDSEVDSAYCLAMRIGLEKEFKHWHHWNRHPRAGCSLSHKQKPENVLISEPQRIAEDRFYANLFLNPQSELMCDHLTGQHVQGMVLIEACRQMFLAVTELFCLDGFPTAGRYFAIKDISINYMEFAFPLPTEIRYHLREKQQAKADRIAFEAEIEVWQTQRQVAGMTVRFTVFDAEHLAKHEATLAGKALVRCMSSMKNTIGSSARESTPCISTTPPLNHRMDTPQSHL